MRGVGGSQERSWRGLEPGPQPVLAVTNAVGGDGWGQGGSGWAAASAHKRGGVWHDAWLRCFLQRAAPAGLSPLTAALPLNPLPPQAAAPIGLSPPCAHPLPAWPVLTSVRPLPFPWEGVPTDPPDCPCFTALCRDHTKEGCSPRRWVRPKGHPHPQRRPLGRRMSTCEGRFSMRKKKFRRLRPLDFTVTEQWPCQLSPILTPTPPPPFGDV